MEFSSELVSSNDNQTQIKMKGKRTKRPRQSSPAAVAAMASISAEDYNSSPSPTSSSTYVYESATEEEEDMANCLILLAQGTEMGEKREETCGGGGGGSGKSAEMVVAGDGVGKAGIYVYECKTCNRSFPSFQALGGHRASHKKPKNGVNGEEMKKTDQFQIQIQTDEFDVEGEKIAKQNPSSISSSIQISGKNNFQGNNKNKTHECSICGSEFASGQALGGHMRRHRAPAPAMEVEKTPRNVLELDLNLPAPEDDHHRDSKFQFVFSSPALVDCHY